jgi:hypothetical protein
MVTTRVVLDIRSTIAASKAHNGVQLMIMTSNERGECRSRARQLIVRITTAPEWQGGYDMDISSLQANEPRITDE